MRNTYLFIIIILLVALLCYQHYNNQKNIDEVTTKINILENEINARDLIINELSVKISDLRHDNQLKHDNINNKKESLKSLKNSTLNSYIEPKTNTDLIISLQNNITTKW